jgi:hypothetical protein
VAKIGFFYAVPRTHAHGGNILQHRRCGGNGLHHMESGVEMASVGDSAVSSYAVMWQFRNPHIPQRKKDKLICQTINVSLLRFFLIVISILKANTFL